MIQEPFDLEKNISEEAERIISFTQFFSNF